MPTPEFLEASAQRLERAKNRVTWQKRFVAKASDPSVRRIGQRVLVTLEEVVATLSQAHELLVERSRRDGLPPEGS